MIFIIGMGKSGTSSLAGLLHNNGICMGENMIIGKGEEQAKGFFENIEMKNINDKILGNWKIKEWNYNKTIENVNCFNEINELLKYYNDRYNEYGFKDPRLCLTIQQWMACADKLKINYKIIYIFRHPGSVGKSLMKYTKIDNIEWAHECWYLFNTNAFYSLKYLNVLFVCYENLINKTDIVCRKISDYLNINIKNNGFIEKKYNRNTNEIELADKIQGLYNKLCRLI